MPASSLIRPQEWLNIPSQAPPRPTRPNFVDLGCRAASKPPEINLIDHQIYCQNGSTTALDLTASRLKYSKMQTALNLLSRVEELAKEMGRLRQEILFYWKYFTIFHQPQERAYDVYQQLFFCKLFRSKSRSAASTRCLALLAESLASFKP
jgi:hypothetical protein